MISAAQTKYFLPFLAHRVLLFEVFGLPLTLMGVVCFGLVCTYLFSYGKAIKTKRTSYLIVVLLYFGKQFDDFFFLKIGQICKSIISFVWSPSITLSLTIMAPAVMFQSAIIRTAVTALLWFHTRAKIIQIFLFMV